MIKAIEASDKKDKRPPVDILLKHLETIGDTFVRLRDHLPEKDILQEVHTLKEIVKKNFASIDDKFTILNHASTTTATLPTSTPTAAKPTYASMLKNALPAPPTIVTKKHEIIVKLNDNNMSSSIQQKSIQEITDIINTATQQTLDITIREAKQLRSGDIAIQAGSEIDVAKLRGSVEWLSDLGSKAKVVRQTFGIIAFSVRTDEVNMEDKEGIIARIQSKNGSVPSLKTLDICWVGWLRKPQEHQRTAHLVIECENAYQANAAIDEGLVIGSELKICRVYNRACRIQQCFNCQNYGHSTPQCVKPIACCYCAGAHISKECKGKPAAKCAACGGNHEAYDRKCHERKKEIVRITTARLSTADRYPITPSSTPPRHPILLLGNNHSPPNKQYKCRQKATPQVYPKQECFAVLLGPNKLKHNPNNFRASSRR